MRPYATAIIGLIIFFVGLRLFSGALKTLASPEWVLAINNPVAMFFITLAVTIVAQSSSITSSALVAIVASGHLGLPAAIGGIIGANVGTTLTAHIAALMANGWTDEARQLAISHTLINLAMAVVALPFARWIAQFVSRW